MIITQLNGRSELLTDHSPPEIHERINADYYLTFTVYRTLDNAYMYNMVSEESIITCDGQQFVIKGVDETATGSGANKTIHAEHIFFSLIDHRFQYEEYFDIEITLKDLMDIMFRNNGYTYSIDGVFEAKYIEDIQPQNHLEFINYVCNLYGAELVRNNKHIVFKNQIGDKTDKQIRYGYNLKTLNRSINTNNLSTAIIGYMDGEMDLPYEYVSPLVDVYGKRYSEPLIADDVFEEVELMKLLKEKLQDYPEISYTIEVTNEKFNLGDTVFTIWEPLDIDIVTRIVEQTRYPENNLSPIVTIANIATNSVDVIAGFGKAKQQIEHIVNDNGTIKLSAMDAQIIKSTNAIMNSMTELEYPASGGILGRSKTSPGNYTIFNSAGIGIFKNGRAVEAITVDGFNLSAGVIGQLTAGNIDVTNLNVHAINILGQVQASQIATNQLIVGNNVTMGPNAYLSWGNVYGAPTIPTTASQIGAMPTSTYIDNYGVFTGQIYANNIKAGTISGVTINGGSLNTVKDVTGLIEIKGSAIYGYGNATNYATKPILFSLRSLSGSEQEMGELNIYAKGKTSQLPNAHLNITFPFDQHAFITTDADDLTIGGDYEDSTHVQIRAKTLKWNSDSLATQLWVIDNFVRKT